MSDILSQDEVDALLKAVDEGGIPPGGGGGGRGGVRTIDLTNLEGSVESRLPGLRPIIDRLARGVRVSLGAIFGQLPNVSPRPAQLIRFGAIAEGLPQPVSLQLFTLAPLRGQGLVIIPPPLVGALLQVFFGGNASRATPIAPRELSAIEQRVLERVGARVLSDLGEAWAPVERLRCAALRSEASARFAAIAAAQDLVLRLDVAVELDGCPDGMLTVCIPNASLDPIRERLQRAARAGDEAPDATWGERLRAAVIGARVEVVAELGSHRLTLRQALALRAGDLVSLGTGREGPVVVRVAGRSRFLGVPGVAGGHNAVRVTAII